VFLLPMMKVKSMDTLAKRVLELKKSSISKVVGSRLREFRENGKDDGKIFSELCFCICTANNSAERGLKAQKEIDFCGLPEPQLRKKMRETVCRFYNSKTEYIMDARRDKDKILCAVRAPNGAAVREWLVKNVKGLGYKEASHLLRNIGHTDVAIIDFHIIDLLEREGIVKRPKTLTKKVYLAVEDALSALAKKTGTSLAELDLYLWYIETGKVLK